MTADVARLLGEHRWLGVKTPFGDGCSCGLTNIGRLAFDQHLADVVGPLIERAAAEAAANVKAAVEKVCAERADIDWDVETETDYSKVRRADIRAALADVPAQPAEAARLRNGIEKVEAELRLGKHRCFKTICHECSRQDAQLSVANRLRALLDGGAK